MTKHLGRTLVEYEEFGENADALAFDHERIKDGQWHDLSAKTNGIYRIKDRRLQFISNHDDDWVNARSHDVLEIETALRSLDPIEERSVVEVSIGKDEDGYFVRDYRWLTPDGGPRIAELSALTREALIRAMEDIDKLRQRRRPPVE